MTPEAEWEPIETAPSNGTPVLLFHPKWHSIEVGMRYGNHCEWQQPSGDLLRAPTHWSALPDGPRACRGSVSGQNRDAGQ